MLEEEAAEAEEEKAEEEEEEEEEVFSVSVLSESRGYSALEEGGYEGGRGGGFVTPSSQRTGTYSRTETRGEAQTAAWKRLGRVKKERRAQVLRRV